MNPEMANPSVDTLRRVPLFAGLNDKELESIAGSMRERTFPEGETVMREGATGAGFFIIEDGHADVTVGGEHRRTLQPGDHFGEIALLTGSERTATIIAKTNLHCYGLTAWDFKPLVEGNPEIAWKLLQSMAERLG
jgi:CRP/FNR family transcriptional regulator, cyclic AMP receptor protein